MHRACIATADASAFGLSLASGRKGNGGGRDTERDKGSG